MPFTLKAQQIVDEMMRALGASPKLVSRATKSAGRFELQLHLSGDVELHPLIITETASKKESGNDKNMAGWTHIVELHLLGQRNNR